MAPLFGVVTLRASIDVRGAVMSCRPYPEEAMEQSACLTGEQYRYTKADASFVQRSIAISLKRIADMMEEDRKPRLELMPEGYIGEQEHRRFMRDTFLRDVNAWETLADAATYIAGRMPLPASCDRSGEAGETTKIGSTEGESAVPEGQTPNPRGGDSRHD